MISNYYRMFSLTAVLVLFFCGPSRAVDMDSHIEDSLKNSYVYTNYLKDDSINVKSEKGIVTLTGTVADENHKTLAKDTAVGLAGVVDVNDQLQVKSKMPDINSDGWVGLKVKAALLYHRSVSALRTRVDVKDGVVTLSGEARSLGEKELAGEFAEDVNGVKSVNNQMTVAETPSKQETFSDKVDDASITAQVKAVLLFHRSTSAIRTSVKTENGVVTLTGTAKDQAEKDLVTKLVNDIKGVDHVINNMNIS